MISELLAVSVVLLQLSGATALPHRRNNGLKFTSIVAFGDSWTDTGRAFEMSNHTLPAHPSYFQGRFSNGPLWIEHVVANTSLPIINMAIGGASTSNDLVPSFATGPGGINIAIPGIDDQVAEFLNSTQDFDSEKPLIVLYGGLNDVNFNFDISPTQVFLSLMKSKARLEAAYPQAEFLFLDYPDLSLIPFDFYLGGLNQSQLATFSRGLTRLFEDMVVNNTLNEKANTHFVSFLDLFGQWDYSRQPRLYGFDPLGAYGSCLVGVYHESDEITLCDDPDSMVYFDKYHASGRAHFWMGRKVLQWLSVRA